MFQAFVLSAVILAAGASADRDHTVIQPLGFGVVKLGDGPLKRQVDEVKAYYLSIPNDDLLKGFRKRAGKPAPGVDLGGWYTDDVFHVFGQVVSGLARLYAATGAKACAEKVDALVDGWGACIEPDGYFYYSRTPNAPHYTYDKMVGGLVDAAKYAGSTHALAYLSKITEWAKKHLDRDPTKRYRPDLNYVEWYTLSENLYRAYDYTRDAKYRDFAKVWEYTWYWDAYAKGRNVFEAKAFGKPHEPFHAYSHLNTLGGAGMAYFVTGQKHYLDTIRNAYDFFQREECFGTGGFGPDETLLPIPELKKRLASTHATFETQCGAWAIFKLCRYLMISTGDARYGDWVERQIYNGIGASIPMSADGHVFYYSDYNTAEAAKRNTDFGWSCCTGTRPEAVADYNQLVFFNDRSSLYVNLFVPASAWWGETQLIQETRFPESPLVDYTLHVNGSAHFALKLRKPSWLAGRVTATVNGKRVPVTMDKHRWIVFCRHWSDNDHLRVRLPMGFWTAGVGNDKGYPASLMYGPVALATRFSAKYPIEAVNLQHPGQGFVPVLGEPLDFHVKGNPGALVRPFYEFKEGEPYVLYVDPAAARRVPQHTIATTGHWNHNALWYTNEVGATITAQFEGAGVHWLGYKFDDGGIADVQIDGKHVATVDQYGPGRELPFDWKIDGLAPGKHTIKLTLTPDKSAASKDRYINAEGFETIGG